MSPHGDAADDDSGDDLAPSLVAPHDHSHEPARPHDHDPPGDHDHGPTHDHAAGPQRGRDRYRHALMHLVKPHSHGEPAIDSVMVADRRGIRALKISLLGLLATAALQLAILTLTASAALLADTLHNVADALTALPIWLAFVVGRRVASARFTYGLGRGEDVAGVIVLVFIAVSALLAALGSIEVARTGTEPSALALLAMAGVVGFAGNELVARYRMRVGRQIGSAALVADGLHARADGFTSLGVVASAALVAIGLPLADPIIGLVIAGAILFTLRDAARHVFVRLLDGTDPAFVDDIRSALAAVEGVEAVGIVRARWIGHRPRVEADVTVDRDLSIAVAHDVAERARHALFHRFPTLADATIHVDPCGHDGSDPHEAARHHLAGVA